MFLIKNKLKENDMKINRMADEHTAPAWAFDDTSVSDFLSENYLSKESWERIQNLPLSDITEKDLVEQRECIEQCSANNSMYHYNSQWPEDVKSSLKEYATVCGMDMSKFKAVHPEYIENLRVIDKQSSDLLEGLEKRETVENKGVEKMMKDPFKLDDLGNNDHMKQANWEEIKKQANMKDRPSMTSGEVKPMRGGEDYFANPNTPTARGNNSISNPNAIGVLANSEEEDTGARLRRENKEKEARKEANSKAWEQDIVDSMKHKDIIPRGKVFPTESLNAQPGIRGEVFDFSSVPDKTQGEKFAEVGEARRQAIQGANKEVHEFTVQKAPVRRISDDFGEALEKALKKNENH
jgi:hypothetical protein